MHEESADLCLQMASISLPSPHNPRPPQQIPSVLSYLSSISPLTYSCILISRCLLSCWGLASYLSILGLLAVYISRLPPALPYRLFYAFTYSSRSAFLWLPRLRLPMAAPSLFLCRQSSDQHPPRAYPWLHPDAHRLRLLCFPSPICFRLCFSTIWCVSTIWCFSTIWYVRSRLNIHAVFLAGNVRK